MTLPSLIWGSPQWMAVTLGLVGLAAGVLLWSYTRAEAKRSVRIAAGVLKALGFAALAISLLEPLLTGSRPRRGANAFVILADNSQSLQIRDGETKQHKRRLDARPACRENPPGRRDWARITTSAAMYLTRTCERWTGFESSDIRWNGECSGDIARGPLETVPGLAACRCSPLYRRQSHRFERSRSVAVRAFVPGRATVAIGRPGCWRHSGFDQSDEFRVGACCRPS